MIASIDSMRKPMMMTIEYVMNAMRSPVWMLPASIWPAPTHTMTTDTMFMIIIMIGIMKTMTRLVNS